MTVPAAPLLTQLPANVPGGSGSGHAGDQAGVPYLLLTSGE